MKLKIHFSHKEELWNSWSHAGGILMGFVVGAIFLYWCFTMHNGWATAGVILYLFGMLMSYIASTVYHAVSAWSKWKERLRKWDHAAIYWHIAGSYSPITLIAMREQGYWGWSLFIFIWACAIAGTIMSFARLKDHSNLETICFDRLRIHRHSLVDYCRRRLLHYGRRILQYQQEEIHAFRVPFFRFSW